MTVQELLMLLLVTAASAAGQLLLRRGASAWTIDRGVRVFVMSVLKGPSIPAALLVLGAPFLYWKVLETVDLSLAYAITAFTGVLVQIGGHYCLKEASSRRRIAGALLCCGGIALWGL